MTKRKLIEVALPLEAINEASAIEREPFTRNHPRAMHIWWARRPHTAARALLFAQLVDDPSSDPTLSEDEQREERERLHRLMRELVRWENNHSDRILDQARAEISRCAGGTDLHILDPFSGGGTIPVEAQRLGLRTEASDLNPVAVLINRALIEYPYAFRDAGPVHPSAGSLTPPEGVEGLAADVVAYGEDLVADLRESCGNLFPRVVLSDNSSKNVIAWIWARTVACPNPACGREAPLTRTWWLSKKKGREAFVKPVIHAGGVEFEIRSKSDAESFDPGHGTVRRTGASCLHCGHSFDLKYIRSEGVEGRLSYRQIARVVEGTRRKIYMEPDDFSIPDDELDPLAPTEDIPEKALGFRVQAYGMTMWRDLYTRRQLAFLTAAVKAVRSTRAVVMKDAASANSPHPAAYADAVTSYLALAVSRYCDMYNTLCSWNQQNENIRALFSRQALPMTWDYAEANPFGGVGLAGPITSVANSIRATRPSAPGRARQQGASTAVKSGYILNTDPPYYDNIGYSDLSDFFYVWLRRMLVDVDFSEFKTVLAPKADELVANPYRHGGPAGAKEFFESGFINVFREARENYAHEYPIVVYYAFKQGKGDDSGHSSSGWETLLHGLISSGWEITGTWPVRSERSSRAVGMGANALASSIALVARPRAPQAPSADRRSFIQALQAELPGALRALQQGAIAPVDLPQAAIGPGMRVFSRYSRVVENDGSDMSVSSALERINEILDEVLNEQEGEFDSTSRFALAWYRQYGYEPGPFGDADSLARARNTSVETMHRDEILTSRAGKVQLLSPTALKADYDVLSDEHTSNWEALHHTLRQLEAGGITAAGRFLATATSRHDEVVDPDRVKELAHLLFRIAEDNKWTRDALGFNTLVTSWTDILEAARITPTTSAAGQGMLDFTQEED